jgi:hypothetical protein
VQDLRTVATADPTYPPILFVYEGEVDDGAAFFARAWPEARAVSDPTRFLYKAFGVRRGTFKQMANPGVIACGIRAASKGHIQGKTTGDPWQMPGMFLLDQDRVIWRHDFAHAGDHPNLEEIPRRASAASAASAA